MMLLCLLAGLCGATSHFQRPAAMVTRSPPSQQVADRTKFGHKVWRAQGPRQGWIVQWRGCTWGVCHAKLEDAAHTLPQAMGCKTHPMGLLKPVRTRPVRFQGRVWTWWLQFWCSAQAPLLNEQLQGDCKVQCRRVGKCPRIQRPTAPHAWFYIPNRACGISRNALFVNCLD